MLRHWNWLTNSGMVCNLGVAGIVYLESFRGRVQEARKDGH